MLVEFVLLIYYPSPCNKTLPQTNAIKKSASYKDLKNQKAQKEKPTHTAFQALSTMKNQFSKDVTKLN